ncbi:MFS general substrate transporter [Plenodomus tracheiphilus IPT5]|uniref:MFS general substrate transporter n=1 Tax=Plenodomus tracheiphilus IPT5 TaxID=1408161 RepID=A0A6A7ASF3_9PLEO|nr:MFS general substrate transporter [Plenodomus tracheiphilus IPT5]
MLAFIALALSMFLAALDTVLIPTALPTISQEFHITDSLYAWVGSSYFLANAASVPFWGKLSDIFGRKSVLLTADTIFLVGSIICAVANTAVMLVAGRVIQGIGGGGVIVLVHVCVSDLFTIRDRSLYMGILGGVWAVASALGPVLGGIFAEKAGWRFCFYLNIPIISFSVIVLYFTLNLHLPKVTFFEGLASMDWLGTLTILTATVMFLVGLQLGGSGTYSSAHVIVFLIVGCLAYVAFPFTQRWTDRRGGSPIMPLRIFKDLSNLSSLAVCACNALVFNSIAYFIPLYFQIVLGRSASTAGVYMLAIAVPLATISITSGHIIEISGRFLEVLQVGLVLMTLGVSLLISFGSSPNLAKIIGVLVVVGIGFGPNFGAPLIALQTRVREADIATGTAAFGFVRMVFGAIGLVVGQVVFQSLMQSHSHAFVDAGIAKELSHALAGGDAISQANAVAELAPDQQAVIKDGLSRAFRGTWIFFAVIAALGVLVSFGIKRTILCRESKVSDANARPMWLEHERTRRKA